MKVLLVGNLSDDKWIGSLIRNLARESDIKIDFFHIITSDRRLSSASQLCENVYMVQRHFPAFLYKIPKIGYLLSYVDVPCSLKKFLQGKQGNGLYDVVNIHYPQNRKLCRPHREKKRRNTAYARPYRYIYD